MIGDSDRLHYGKRYVKRMLHRADDAWMFDSNYHSGGQSVIMVKVNGLAETNVQKAMTHLEANGICSVLHYNNNTTLTGKLDDYDVSYQALYTAINRSNEPDMPAIPEYEEVTEYENRMRAEGYRL